MNKKIVILQHRLLHYRVGLFNSLRACCASHGLSLHLVHGQPTAREQKKNDIGELSWADKVTNYYVTIGGKDILFQPFPSKHFDADLVILMQENRIISNYPWQLFRNFHKRKIAFWGHGRNFQTDNPSGIRESWKKLMIGNVDWWFAYTDITRDILLADRYPSTRITVLNNAIDNVEFESDLSNIDTHKLVELRGELGIVGSSKIGLYCGSLYPDKRLDFLVDAVDRIRTRIPEFHLLIIGDGPSATDIRNAALTRPWLHWLGVRKGIEKASYYKLADIILNPGLVGLHVLDAFCAGIPMVTTVNARHSPEIAYLKHGENGLIINGNSAIYGDAVIQLLGTTETYQSICANALVASRRYTLQNMVENFIEGIERCLAMSRKK